MDPRQVLRQVFGYEAFRGPQEEIVAHVVAGGSGLVLMPTGGGKSLCYQVPALCRTGTAVVISPLIALMQDQVEALRQAGVRAAALHSGIDAAETQAIVKQVENFLFDPSLRFSAEERIHCTAKRSPLLRGTRAGICRVVPAIFLLRTSRVGLQFSTAFCTE